MAISNKYGTIDIPNIGKDEPIFILRAQDKLAEATIELYKILLVSHDVSLGNTIQQEVDRFRSWNGPKKMPD